MFVCVHVLCTVLTEQIDCSVWAYVHFQFIYGYIETDSHGTMKVQIYSLTLV